MDLCCFFEVWLASGKVGLFHRASGATAAIYAFRRLATKFCSFCCGEYDCRTYLAKLLRLHKACEHYIVNIKTPALTVLYPMDHCQNNVLYE